jgi:hypothetical protein
LKNHRTLPAATALKAAVSFFGSEKALETAEETAETMGAQLSCCTPPPRLATLTDVLSKARR